MAAGHQVVRILLAFPGAGDDEVNAHDQGVLEAGSAVQPAVPATVIVAFQDPYAFLEGYGAINQRERREIQRHGAPPQSEIIVKRREFLISDCLSRNDTAAGLSVSSRVRGGAVDGCAAAQAPHSRASSTLTLARAEASKQG